MHSKYIDLNTHLEKIKVTLKGIKEQLVKVSLLDSNDRIIKMEKKRMINFSWLIMNIDKKVPSLRVKIETEEELFISLKGNVITISSKGDSLGNQISNKKKEVAKLDTLLNPDCSTGTLKVSSAESLRIYEKGKFIGMTNVDIPDLKAGSHKIEIRGEGFAVVSDTVTIKSDITNIQAKREKLSTLATFVGGQESFRLYLLENLRYPETAYRRQIGGTVEIGFVVDAKGVIEHVEVIKGVERTLDSEAMKVIQNMPDWVPATLNGKNVKSFVIVPIVFSAGQ